MPKATISKCSVQSLMIHPSYDGTRLMTGTGFVVMSARGPVLITNRHNVTGRHQVTGKPLLSNGGLPNELEIWHNDTRGLGNWQKHREPLYDGETPRWIEHPSYGPKVDFVALPLTSLQAVQLYPYDTNPPPDPLLLSPGEVVSVVGFPFQMTAGGRFAIWATGFIATEPAIDMDTLPLMLIDCRSRQGQSGSPVIANRTGAVSTLSGLNIGGGPVTQLVGVYSGRISGESDLGLVWKTAAVHELVLSIQ
ncbi:MAG: trypsin-like peptidase domain-containing protein [Gammaproteobacteria bacterium]